MSSEKHYCSRQEGSIAEPLAGSTILCKQIFLIEVRHNKWGPNPLSQPEQGSVNPDLAARLHAVQDAVHGSKVLFISPEDDAVDEGCRAYVYPQGLEYRGLGLTETVGAIERAAEGNHDGWRKADKPVVLICSHGVKDACCAMLGFPLFKAAKAIGTEQDIAVWRVSHVGGCRMAPIAIVLPYGFVYGRLKQNQAAELIEDARSGYVSLTESYRGPVFAEDEDRAFANAMAYTFAKDKAIGKQPFEIVNLHKKGVPPEHQSLTFTIRYTKTGATRQVEAMRVLFDGIVPHCDALAEGRAIANRRWVAL